MTVPFEGEEQYFQSLNKIKKDKPIDTSACTLSLISVMGYITVKKSLVIQNVTQIKINALQLIGYTKIPYYVCAVCKNVWSKTWTTVEVLPKCQTL